MACTVAVTCGSRSEMAALGGGVGTSDGSYSAATCMASVAGAIARAFESTMTARS